MDNISKVPPEDSAAEKLVEIKSDYSSKDQKVEVKYMTDSQNGDTKIDIENLKNVFVGMGKEELMKYANDPFWVKMRCFLFILFWIVWFAMLSGAISIIVLAPKCAAPMPREWYEQSPIYKVDFQEISDESVDSPNPISAFQGLERQLNSFEELGVNTILVDSLMKSSNGNKDVEDFMSLDSSLGSILDFKKLIRSMKEKGFYLLMNFIPNHSSDKHEWFKKSVLKEEPYKDYYVWAPSKGRNGEGHHIPPNNWLSIAGGSAWEWSEARGEFYLHQFNKTQPDLNFRNPVLVNFFKGVFKFWLDLGLSGFHLSQVEYLFEDDNFKNESIDSAAIGATHDQYVFYTHRHTKYLPDSFRVVKDWVSFIQNNSGIVAVSDLGIENEKIGDMYWKPIEVYPELDADTLNEIVEKRLNKSSPVWEWNCKEPKFCVSESFARGLQMSLLLLPGTSIIKSNKDFTFYGKGITNTSHYGNVSLEGGISDSDSSKSAFDSYKSLIEARFSPSVMYGVTQTAVLNSTVFSYSRIKSGNPGYLIAFNLGDEVATVSFQDLRYVPQEVAVVAFTTELDKMLSHKYKIPSSSVTIPSKNTLVVTFVPVSDSK